MRTMIFLAVLLPLAGFCGEAVLGTGGVLRLASPTVALRGCC